VQEIAQNIFVVPFLIANTYLVGNAQGWVLVDSGTPGNEGKLKEAAESRFGPGAKPNAIVLTHGHFDHAGSAKTLAELWGVRVYAHRLELPYLTGQSSYPPPDPTTPGFFSALSRFFPARTVNLSPHVAVIDSSQPFKGVEGWECLDTPGHTPGHLAFYRRSDGTLLAGDALTTMNLDSFADTLIKRQQVCRPPTPATTDWPQARQSVQLLAGLQPKVIAAGHGKPMTNAADQLQKLADNFPIPEQGRYVAEPARANENGVNYLPPAPPDRIPKVITGLAAGVVLTAAGAWIVHRQR
jgi:glyoxylase-like metal-dependent hydrolase (beta-lactamase superfamily II)